MKKNLLVLSGDVEFKRIGIKKINIRMQRASDYIGLPIFLWTSFTNDPLLLKIRF